MKKVETENDSDSMEIESSGFSPIVTPVMGRPKKAKTPRLQKPKQNSQKNKGIYNKIFENH